MMPPCPEMRIAQGHTALENNRWIAGTKCYHQNQRTEVPLWPYQCHIFCRRLGVWSLTSENRATQEYPGENNHFATHYAESAIFVAWNVPVSCGKQDGQPLKRLKRVPYSFLTGKVDNRLINTPSSSNPHQRSEYLEAAACHNRDGRRLKPHVASRRSCRYAGRSAWIGSGGLTPLNFFL